MAKTVRKVKHQLQGTIPPIIKKLNLRVAAYARVSTNSEQQHTSIEAQKDYYAKMIGFRLDWSFAGLYIDNGTFYRERAKFILTNCSIDSDTVLDNTPKTQYDTYDKAKCAARRGLFKEKIKSESSHTPKKILRWTIGVQSV